MSQPDIPFPDSPVIPNMVDGTHVIEFSCHKGISCWNACCSNIDISLTPYDVLRMKRHLGISSTEFLKEKYGLKARDIAAAAKAAIAMKRS